MRIQQERQHYPNTCFYSVITLRNHTFHTPFCPYYSKSLPYLHPLLCTFSSAVLLFLHSSVFSVFLKKHLQRHFESVTLASSLFLQSILQLPSPYCLPANVLPAVGAQRLWPHSTPYPAGAQLCQPSTKPWTLLSAYSSPQQQQLIVQGKHF